MLDDNDMAELERVFWYEIIGRNDFGCTHPETHEDGTCARAICVIAEIVDSEGVHVVLLDRRLPISVGTRTAPVSF